jgi:adenylate kinase
MLIVLLGPPGAGKGTQAKTVAETLDVVHIASGDLLRDHQARDTDLGRQARSYMERGALVPDDLVIRMILDRMAEESGRQGAVLDGFPRTLTQAEALDASMEGSGIDQVLYIAVPADELVRRLGGRLICRSCQRPYQQGSAPERCTECGGELYQRDDDRPEAVRNRIQVYEEQTFPLVEYYRSQCKLKELNGKQAIEAVTRDLLAAVAA